MILTVIGARPQFVKAAVVSKALKEAGIEERIIHTGQHYDEKMSDIFWTELGIPLPEKNLMVGSGLHGEQTAHIMIALEKEVIRLKPRALMVYGDTNSTLAGAVVASKLQVKVIHIEAGLRSFNRAMPEEINRILTDHASDILFCSSGHGVNQLRREGIINNVYDTGDVMCDAVHLFGPLAEKKITLKEILPFKCQPFILATIHRPTNTDNTDNLGSILEAFSNMPFNVVWPMHPRNKRNLSAHHIPQNVFIISPASYLEMLVLLKGCSKVCTDSGGLQKEAYWLKKPCITLRNETEWAETLHNNWNILTGANMSKIAMALTMDVLKDTWYPLYGKGDSSTKIASILKHHLTSE